MYIFFDESIHKKYGFILLGYVICPFSPQRCLKAILNEYKMREFHSLDNMEGNTKAQKLRARMRAFINCNCKWGLIVYPDSEEIKVYNKLSDFIYTLISNTCEEKSSANLIFDEGIISNIDVNSMTNILKPSKVCNCKSHEVAGIQLADLVAATCGVRLREEISQEPKMLTYGSDCGFDPPIEADLGYELWASLRYSMCRSPEPLGEDMPEMAEFETIGYGLFVSDLCSDVLSEAAKKLFGQVYLGCIH